MKYFFFFLSFSILVACSHQEKNDKEEAKNKAKENPYLNSTIEVHTFQNTDSTWGYDISVDGKRLILQPSIPSLPGNEGFIKQEYAKVTGELVAVKIRNNIFPPVLSREELDSIGVLQ